MCGPDFGFANFTISCTKERTATPESEPEEDDIYYEDQAVLEAGLAGSDLKRIDASTAGQNEGISSTKKRENAGTKP
ncbi:hypothetical protein L1987_03818 [Smallanthus sonchifolius]|uniref:Uncharacterized protein n=1 Tax=Smallanthus sonchifolius TaxID=185202 RepID=A0ACB9KBV7_9ASTR|nr:hypothetical protein L1987_03818 [Smallanthus sonchifolius]